MKKTALLLNGLPGNMSSLILEALLEKNEYNIVPETITGEQITDPIITVHGVSFLVHHPYPDTRAIFEIRKSRGPHIIAVDFSLASEAMKNIQFYCDNNTPFVMGTTGVDFVAAKEMIAKSNISAVIAPNFASPIVMLDEMLAYAAREFPGILNGYHLGIKESHQGPDPKRPEFKGKQDASGTATKFAGHFRKLGTPFENEDMILIRYRYLQEKMGVPEEFLDGHAYHDYEVISPDEALTLGFQHNVRGRQPYVAGVLRAIEFEDAVMRLGSQGQLYSQLDVMRHKF
jgi:4-hydroxy-tetrahydrodipicolinate reductase